MKRTALLILLALTGMACKKDPAASGAAAPTPTGSADSAPPISAAKPKDPWQTAPEASSPAITKPLLWSITKDGKTSYAFGTMHVGIDPDRLPAVVFAKLEASPAFAMETNAADGSILGLGRRASGTLHDDLGPDYYKKLEALLGADMVKHVDSMKPVIAAVMLSLRGLPMSGGGMDTSLQARAQGKHKTMIYLEPAAKQAALLEKWMDARALKLMIDTADRSLEVTKGMAAAYLAGDDAKLIALNDSQKADALSHGYTEAEVESQENEMLYDRNASWIPALEQMHAKGGGFVAVGALHLVGKRSVLDLLASKGYTITRIAQ